MGYKTIFYGFIFLFDFRFLGFDVLPDFIGYIMIYDGLKVLKDKNKFFSEAKGLAFPMIFISLLDIYQNPNPINSFSNYSLNIGHIIFILVTIIFNLLLVSNLCNGVKSEARHANLLTLESDAQTVWTLYFVSNLFILSRFILADLLPLILIISFIVSFIAYVLMLSLMNSASRKLQ